MLHCRWPVQRSRQRAGLNLNGPSLIQFVDTTIAQGFLPPQQKGMLIVESDPLALLAAFRTFAPVATPKWM